MTAREVAKRARAQQLHVSNEVVRVSSVYQPPSFSRQRTRMPPAATWDIVDMDGLLLVEFIDTYMKE